MRLIVFLLALGVTGLLACMNGSTMEQQREHLREPAARQDDSTRQQTPTSGTVMFEIRKSEEEWRRQLTPEQYHVVREKGTEAPFTGKYDKHFEEGMYACVACGEPLFISEDKFDSHCGWPSFSAPFTQKNVLLSPDHSYGMRRTEVQCHKCGAHLGHVFDDGPAPTGLRYCINSASLKFLPAEQSKNDDEK